MFYLKEEATQFLHSALITFNCDVISWRNNSDKHWSGVTSSRVDVARFWRNSKKIGYLKSVFIYLHTLKRLNSRPFFLQMRLNFWFKVTLNLEQKSWTISSNYYKFYKKYRVLVFQFEFNLSYLLLPLSIFDLERGQGWRFRSWRDDFGSSDNRIRLPSGSRQRKPRDGPSSCSVPIIKCWWNNTFVIELWLVSNLVFSTTRGER